MMKTKTLLVAYILFGCAPWARGQERIFQHFTVQDGLPSNNVYSAMQDQNGYIWFCTDAGVSRFNGRDFTNFTIRDGLQNNEMFNCAETPDGKIVFNGHKSGVCYYEKGHFYSPVQYPWLANKQSPSNYVAADRDGNIWYNIVSDLMSLYKVNFKQQTLEKVYNHPGEKFRYVHGGVIDSIAFEDYNWVFEEKARLLKLIRQSGTQPSAESTLQTVFKEVGGWAPARRNLSYIRFLMVWLSFDQDFLSMRTIRSVQVGADSTLLVFTNNEGTLYYPRLPGPGVHPQVILPGKTISGLIKDKEGNTWITTMNEGVYMFRANETYSYNALLPVTPVYSLAIYNNSLALGQEDRAGLLYNNRYQSIWLGGARRARYMGLYNRIKALHALPNGIIYLGSDLGIYEYTPRPTPHVKLLNTAAIKGLCSRNQGGIYFSYHNGTGYVDGAGVVPTIHYTRRTTSIYEDPGGTLWVGTPEGLYNFYNDSLYRFTTAVGSITAEITSLGGAGPYCLAATSGNGVYVIRNGRFAQVEANTMLPRHERLSSDICRRVVPKDSASFWVCTNKGVNLVKITSWQPFRYRVWDFTTRNGLLSDDIYDLREWDGRVWVGGGNGLCSFYEKDLYKPDMPPQVNILNADALDGRQFENGSRLLFEFGGVSLQSMGEISYHYRLLGYSPEWDTTRDASVRYGPLPKGHYQLQVYAVSRSGQRSAYYATVSFDILRPWWQRPLLMAAMAAGLLLVLYLLYRQVAAVARRREQKKQEHLNQLQQLELKALRSQMNPHFIFNSMNSVQKYILNNDAEAACRYLVAFSSLIRQVLENARYSFVPLQKEIDLLEAYIQLEQQRFKQKFTYEITVGPGLQPAALLLPPMLIQPFVENAIWHGIQHNTQDGRIAITFTRYHGNMLLCTVEDNGAGRAVTITTGGDTTTGRHRSLGVSITGQRLAMLNGARHHGVNIRYSTPFPGDANPGTRVEIFIVCNNHPHDKSHPD